MLDSILHQHPVPMVGLNPDVPEQLESIVAKCLEKDRDLRYQHASDLRSDLTSLKHDLESARLRGVTLQAEPGVGEGQEELRTRRSVSAQPTTHVAERQVRGLPVRGLETVAAIGAVQLSRRQHTGAFMLLLSRTEIKRLYWSGHSPS